MIPEGYRLLTNADVGKVFGKDLETLVYFDNSVVPINWGNFDATNFITYENPSATQRNIKIYLSSSLEVYRATVGWRESSAVFIDNVEITSFRTVRSWNNWFYVKDIVPAEDEEEEETTSDPKTQFITDMNDLAESIVGKAGSSGKKTIKEMKSLVDGLKTEFVTQEKTVTPTKSSQAITPDSGKDGLSKVTVNAIPSNYIVPSGELEITANGTHDVTDKASVIVNVPSVVAEQWNGSYEEISSGYTVTLQLGTYDSKNPFTINTGYTYSIDGGITKIPLYNQSVPIVLNNVQTIGFYGSSPTSLYLGSTLEGTEYGGLHYESRTEIIIPINQDTTIYVSASSTSSGGGSD